jgi:hypothetical protein
MYLSVKKVVPLTDYKLLLTFENEEVRMFDLAPYLETGKFSELKDSSMFNSVTISFDSIAWANHLDVDPEFLYRKSKTVTDPKIL